MEKDRVVYDEMTDKCTKNLYDESTAQSHLRALFPV